MTLAIGLFGYVLLILAAALIDIKLGVAAAGIVCLYISFANQTPKGA